MASSSHASNHRQTFKILSWNCNGLLSRKLELTHYMQVHDIDIVLLSETHLTSRSTAKIYGYQLYTCNNPDDFSHGGSAIYIKSGITHHPLPSFRKSEIQLTIISAQLHCGTTVNVGAIYCPPRHTIHEEQFTDAFSTLGPKWVVGDDLNAKHPYWGSRLTSSRGRELFKSIMNNGYSCVSAGEPTYWPADANKRPDCIDFFVTYNLSPNYSEIMNDHDLSSDHTPLVLTISDTLIRKTATDRLITNSTDWDVYRDVLHDKIDLKIRLKNKDDLDNAFAKFTNDIKTSAKMATPLSKPTVPKVVYYPREVSELVKLRRKARHLWQETRDPAHKNAFNKLCARTKRLIAKIRQESFEQFLQTLDGTKDTNYSIWKVARTCRKPANHVPPLRKSDNSWALTDRDKANVFAEHLEKTFQPNDIYSDVLPTTEYNFTEDFHHFTPTQIRKMADKLRTRKAPGRDGITGQLIKELPRKGFVLLTYLFNAVVRLQYIPKEWKTAKVILLLKPGKPSDQPQSYRPISLLPVMSKLFEKLFLLRIMKTVEEKNIIPDHQFGFRRKHAALEQVHRVANIIRLALEEKKFCPAVFLDVKQAFDRVWIPGLLHKVSRYLPAYVIGVLESYLTKRQFQVHFGQSISELKPIAAGVPQGSVLGPLLYTLFTADIPLTQSSTLATFADDTAILVTDKDYSAATHRLQHAVEQVTQWSQRWKIAINHSKSTRVDFALRPHPITPTIIDGTVIPHGSHAKYLGLTLDSKLLWRTHVTLKRDELNARFRTMFWMFRHTNRLSLANRRLLYQTVIRPVWTYGIQLWGSTATTNYNVIQTFQNKVLRKITGAPWFVRNDTLHADLKIETVAETAKRLTAKYERRLHNHVNIEAILLLEEPSVRRLQRRFPLFI